MHYGIHTSEAKHISRTGRYRRRSAVSVKFLDTDGEYRYSAVVSKKQGNAVERNRIKRVIREIMRLKIGEYPPGLYMIYFNGPCKGLIRDNVMNDLNSIMQELAERRN